jgi:hypothetical protein
VNYADLARAYIEMHAHAYDGAINCGYADTVTRRVRDEFGVEIRGLRSTPAVFNTARLENPYYTRVWRESELAMREHPFLFYAAGMAAALPWFLLHPVQSARVLLSAREDYHVMAPIDVPLEEMVCDDASVEVVVTLP